MTDKVTRDVTLKLLRDGVLTKEEAQTMLWGPPDPPTQPSTRRPPNSIRRRMCQRCKKRPSFCALQTRKDDKPLNTCRICHKEVTGLKEEEATSTEL